MNQTWNKTKPQEHNNAWACSKCVWNTETEHGEYSIPILVCPNCGEKVKKYNIYVCNICNEHCWGVNDFNFHHLDHFSYDMPLPQNVAVAMQKFCPELWKARLSYLNRKMTLKLERQ